MRHGSLTVDDNAMTREPRRSSLLSARLNVVGGSAEEGKAAFRDALRRGRPKAESVKESLTVRYDTDVVAAFRASGPGWQSRMNAALREWLETHSPA